ncbi:TOTE conflict system archaeo-eukaryotic primase domain-containing protein [Cytobacillus dafuensis]|nr:reverse transcriptase domain-containing protein [Cytobacillus dafuensis]
MTNVNLLSKKIDNNNLKEISKVLERRFFYNKEAYGKQQFDDNRVVVYKTIYNKIDPNVIKNAIENKQAIMAYQQKFDKLKWLCLDFDIKSSVLYEDYNFHEDSLYKPMLINDLHKIIETLHNYNIKYLLEYSGNRGFHVWIFLDKEINKQLGSTLLNGILSLTKFDYIDKKDSPITVDKFPKNNKPKGNKIGLGVKVPLSYHLKSNSYSYVIDDYKNLFPLIEITEKFLIDQKLLIEQVEHNSVDRLIDILNINSLEETKEFDRVTGKTERQFHLNQIIKMLSKCKVYEYIFSKDINQLTELDRTVLVGTIVRLKTKDNIAFGKDLLIEYFSRDADIYNEEITKEKLFLMENYFPPSLTYLQNKYNIKCNYCESQSISNVLELLDDIEIETKSQNLDILKWVIKSEKKYLTQNDEIPLNYVYDSLDSLNEEKLSHLLEEIKFGKFPNITFNKFIRNEEDKERILFGLSARDRVLTTAIMFEINKILYGEFSSSNSYSYRLNYDFKKNDIFVNWNTLWLNYVKDIEDKILNEAYDNYYILKLDIKSFYEEINQVFLREMLYSKPTPMVELVLRNLNTTEKKFYINMCEYLIYAAERTSEKGVPQGPAFARYLAEIYLSSLDRLINSKLIEGFEHYFRYVDDLVIVLETKEKAEELFNLIKTHLGTRDLELNHKVKKGYVSDLKYDVISQDLEKYFIDGIDEATAPKKVIDKAITLLNKMFRNQEENINIKHLPFFLTHLINNDYIQSKLEEIILEITSSIIGRGSLFKHFYKNIIFGNLEKVDLKFYDHIYGLSRANFINELSRNIEKVPIVTIEQILKYYVNEELEPYEKIELYRVILKSGCNLRIIYDEQDLDIFIMLLQHTKAIKWDQDLLNQILKYLQSIEDKINILKIMDKILTNSHELDDNTRLVETLYITLSEHAQYVYKDHIKQLIFNLIAYLSLYIDENKIIEIWCNFHNLYQMTVESISTQEWYNYEKLINKNQIKDGSVIFILTRIFKKEGIDLNLGTNKTEEDYALYLFLYLFENKEFSGREEMKHKVREITKDKNIQFLDWCLSEDSRYFPNDETAIKNIRYNNRIVMMKNNELLVRGRPEIFVDYSESIIESESWYDNSQYKFMKLNIQERLMNLEEKINSMNLFKALDFVLKVKSESEFNGKYVNVFERGAFIESNNSLNLTFSKYDKVLVLEKSEPILNNKVKFTDELINTLLKARIAPLSYTFGPLEYHINVNDFKDDFIPKSITNNEEIIVYLEIFNNNLEKYLLTEGENIYSIELSKLMSIRDYVNTIENKKNLISDIRTKIQINRSSSNIKILNLYNSLYKNNTFEKHLIYSASKVNVNSLTQVINDIIGSIKSNMEFDDINFIVDFLIKELAKVTKLSTDITQLNFVEIERHINDESLIKISKIDFPIEDISFYEFGSNEDQKELTSKEIYRLLDLNYLYFDGNLLVALPNALGKTIEIIENKKGNYDKKNLVINATIRNTDYYLEALDVIRLQSDVSRNEADRRLNTFLLDVESKYYESILKVVSSYRCFTEEDMKSFVDIIKEKVDHSNGNDCFFPLKSKNDDNGLHQILYLRYKETFERDTIYEKRINGDIDKLKKQNKFDELILISDLGLSGSQLKNTLNSYISVTKGKNLKKGFHTIKDGGIFKDNLLNSSQITFLNCIYTDTFRETVIEYFINELGYPGKLNFIGIEISFKEHLFNTKVKNKRHKDLFIEFVKKYYSAENLRVQGKCYFEYLEQIEKADTRNMLIARYKSMPKYHNVVFTKNTSLLKYRDDQ